MGLMYRCMTIRHNIMGLMYSCMTIRHNVMGLIYRLLQLGTMLWV